MEATTAHGYHSPGASGLSPGLATRRTWRTPQAHVNTGGRRSWDPCTSAGPAAPRTGATPRWRPQRSAPPPPAPPPPPPARREAAALVRMHSPPPPPPSRWRSPTRQGSRAARHGAVPAALGDEAKGEGEGECEGGSWVEAWAEAEGGCGGGCVSMWRWGREYGSRMGWE